MNSWADRSLTVKKVCLDSPSICGEINILYIFQLIIDQFIYYIIMHIKALIHSSDLLVLVHVFGQGLGLAFVWVDGVAFLCFVGSVVFDCVVAFLSLWVDFLLLLYFLGTHVLRLEVLPQFPKDDLIFLLDIDVALFLPMVFEQRIVFILWWAPG